MKPGVLPGIGVARRSIRGLFLSQIRDACHDNAETSDHRQDDAADRKMERVNAIPFRGF
jgi:hypothetical protein